MSNINDFTTWNHDALNEQATFISLLSHHYYQSWKEINERLQVRKVRSSQKSWALKFKSSTWKLTFKKSFHTCQMFTHCRWCKHERNQWRSEVQECKNVFSEKRKSVVNACKECMILYLYHSLTQTLT